MINILPVKLLLFSENMQPGCKNVMGLQRVKHIQNPTKYWINKCGGDDNGNDDDCPTLGPEQV
jgi:hypothetical protein